jgi:hypothetical protein
VSLERGSLSLVSTTEELLERKSSGSILEKREYGCKDSSRWRRGTFYPQKLVLTSPTSGGRSVGIVRSRTQVTEFSFSLWFEVLTAVMNVVISEIPPCSPYVNRRLGGMHHLHLQGRKSAKQETSLLIMLLSFCLVLYLLCLFLRVFRVCFHVVKHKSMAVDR